MLHVSQKQAGAASCTALLADSASCSHRVWRTIVLADEHVLDGLSRAGHVHAVRQVRPPQARVGDLVLQHLVCAIPHDAGDVVILGQATLSAGTAGSPSAAAVASLACSKGRQVS